MSGAFLMSIQMIAGGVELTCHSHLQEWSGFCAFGGLTRFLWKSRKQAIEVSHPAAIRLPRGWGTRDFCTCRKGQKQQQIPGRQTKGQATATAKTKCGSPSTPPFDSAQGFGQDDESFGVGAS